MTDLLKAMKLRCRHCPALVAGGRKGKVWICDVANVPCIKVKRCLEWPEDKGTI